MSRLLLLVLSMVTVVSFANVCGAQVAPDLGAASSYALFTNAGAFTSDGATVVTGDIGTNAGAFTGFPVGVVIGETHVADLVSAQVALDVSAAYDELTPQSCDVVLGTTLGNGQVLTPNVYCLGGASTLNGNLILNGGGVAGGIFIIKINGALSANAFSSVTLTNMASLDNVYWQINGRLDLAASAVFRGTVLAAGAIELMDASSLIGRGLTTAGAISLHTNIVTNPQAALPVTLTSFTVKKDEGQKAILSWTTTAETNSDRFEVQHSMTGKVWKKLGTVTANGESSMMMSYAFTDEIPGNGNNLYRLKMIDRDESFSYSSIRSVAFSIAVKMIIYPNPAIDLLTLEVDDMSQIRQIQLNDVTGKTMYIKAKTGLQNLSAHLDVKDLPAGIYLVRITSETGTVSSLKILKH
ncbi:ice-binding family protein [Dyadobacter sp. CY312]|uniref:ice-binding family protein n=1 Tax=Dyadobacter sp. CY312 TaxID=2907303 RepID=UPI001F178116|nr:ice-binding family protein [Dyadobacter sp. CY312]MCE7042811.1 ice-binding family protein [Dyadobacter sp. CY312]